MSETPEEWLGRLFEFEFCPECGGDTEDHEVWIITGMGNYFARCLRAAPDADPNGGERNTEGASRGSGAPSPT